MTAGIGIIHQHFMLNPAVHRRGERDELGYEHTKGAFLDFRCGSAQRVRCVRVQPAG